MGRRHGRGAADLLAEHLMVGKPLGDQVAKHPLDRDVDLGDEIDRRPSCRSRMLRPKRAICRSPARTTASTAVVRKSGSAATQA